MSKGVFLHASIVRCDWHSDRLQCTCRLLLSREIQLHRGLHHPNVVEILDVFENTEKQKIYIIMEYCPFDLTRLMEMNMWGLKLPSAEINMTARARSPDQLARPYDANESLFSCSSLSASDSPETFPLPIEMARHYFKQLVDGLLFLSSRSIIHHGSQTPARSARESFMLLLDIKPANLLIGLDGALKITDFGVARRLEPLEPECDFLQGPTLGSPAFQAPETLLDGPPMHSEFKLDVWAAGITL